MESRDQQIIGELQERNAILQKCLEEMSNVDSLKKAKENADQCLGALAVVENVTPRIPMWVGVVLEGMSTDVKICIGLNQEDGHDVSWKMNEDEDWILCQHEISVKYSEKAMVFDKDNNLIK
jgi:hypothetical protein